MNSLQSPRLERTFDASAAYAAVYEEDRCVLCGGSGVRHCSFEPIPERQAEIGGTAENPLVAAFGCCRRCMSDPDWKVKAEYACFREFGEARWGE
jgi:hypothetical protein